MFGEKAKVCSKKISCFSDDNPTLERRKIQLCLPKCKPGVDKLDGLYTFKFLKQNQEVKQNPVTFSDMYEKLYDWEGFHLPGFF